MVKFYRRAFSTSDLWVSANDQLSDFYASSWQRGDSPVPLLIIRLLLTAIALAVLIWSIIEARSFYWLIFLTNWGFLLITLMLVNGSVVSIYATSKRNYESEDSVIPWYVSSYWLLFNCSVPVAFLITALYWGLLYDNAGVDEELNHGLDIAVHGLNTLVMFLLVVSSGHPSRLLHVYQPFAFALCYLAFGLIYYYADGVDTKGNRWVYSVVNWAQPGTTAVVCIVTGLLLCLMHFITVGIALVRDRVALIFNSTTTIKETVPLRPTNV